MPPLLRHAAARYYAFGVCRQKTFHIGVLPSRASRNRAALHWKGLSVDPGYGEVRPGGVVAHHMTLSRS